MKFLIILNFVILLPLLSLAKNKLKVRSEGVLPTEVTVQKDIPLNKATAFAFSWPGTMVILADGKLYEARTGKILTDKGKTSKETVTSFDIHSNGGGLLTSRGGKFGYLGTEGIVEKVEMPFKNMEIAIQKTPYTPLVVFYGGDQPGKYNYIYLYKFNNTFQTWAQVPEPVTALTTDQTRILFATRDTIFEDTKVRVVLPGEEVVSIAPATRNDDFFFSTHKGIFYVNKKSIHPLLLDVDCKINTSQWDNSLWALCPSTKKVWRLQIRYDLMVADSEISAPANTEKTTSSTAIKEPKTAEDSCVLARQQKMTGLMNEGFDSAMNCYHKSSMTEAKMAALSLATQIYRNNSARKPLPESDVQLLAQAQTLIIEKKFSKAAKLLKQAIEHSPWFTPTYLVLAQTYVADEEDSDAFEILKIYEKISTAGEAKHALEEIKKSINYREVADRI